MAQGHSTSSYSPSYPSSKVGCLAPSRLVLQQTGCDYFLQKFEYYKNHIQDKDKKVRQDVRLEIVKRAQHFLSQKEWDYFSIVNLMVFSRYLKPQDMDILTQFKKLPGKRPPFATVAKDRIAKKDSRYCHPQAQSHLRSTPLAMQEICSLPIQP